MPPRQARLPTLALAAVTAVTAVAIWAAPATGLPAGEPASVTIQSYAGNQVTSNDIEVQLLLTWPAGADHVQVGNGDGSTQTLAVADVVSWQLVPLPSTSAGATRTVTVTFTGADLAPVTVSDDILLDTKPARLPVQRLFQNGKGWFLGAQPEDDGAGVSAIALLGSTGQPLTGQVLCSATLCDHQATVTFFLDHVRPRQARITDAAGNAKAVRLVRRTTRCDVTAASYPVFKPADRFYDCVRPGQRCTPDDGHYWNRSDYVRCRKVAGRFRVVERG